MNRILLGLALVALSMSSFARGGGSGHGHSGSHGSAHASPGTGANPGSTHVSGYTRHDGTAVHSHQRSSADGQFNNNWTTKGNTNPHTGAEGTRVTPSGSRSR